MPRPKGSGNPSELVQLAIVGIDTQIQRLEAQIAELNEKRRQLAKDGSVAATAKVAGIAAADGRRKKRVVSAATKKKLKEAAKARWAKARAEKEGKK